MTPEKNMNKGKILICIGILLILSSIGITIYNKYEDLNIEELYNIAQKHKITSLIYGVLSNIKNLELWLLKDLLISSRMRKISIRQKTTCIV